MIHFNDKTSDEFLTQYWQKKPLLIRSALPQFVNPLSADELAGLAMEDEIESRLVIQPPDKLGHWQLKHGPFTEEDFKSLPQTHWTLLVQGVDRFIPTVTSLLDHFNFLPQWRIDDVMISYAVEHGSVGPHYDNYDVFLFQAQGRRKWLLTTQDCVESNYEEDSDLRIMKRFKTENEYILEAGDMLYLPPHVAHHGISLDDECMTYSFGYRSYQSQELWDSFGEYLAATQPSPTLYQDPQWTTLKNTSEIPEEAWKQAKSLLLTRLNDETLLKKWFAAFATSLDRQAESLLPMEEESSLRKDDGQFKKNLMRSAGLMRNPLCRFAYLRSDKTNNLSLYINGREWSTVDVAVGLIELVANNRTLLAHNLLPFFDNGPNQTFLYTLWKLQWLLFLEDEL